MEPILYVRGPDGEFVRTGGAVSSVNGKTGAVVLTAKDVGALAVDDLQGAVNDALAQAKASGEFDGRDGTSITIEDVLLSFEDDQYNEVTFSDGHVLTVKNGSRGRDGSDGKSITVVGSYESSFDDDWNGFVLSNGMTLRVKNGKTGRRGCGYLRITTLPTNATGEHNGVPYSHYIGVLPAVDEAGVEEILVGDVLVYADSTFYPVVGVTDTKIYLSAKTGARGRGYLSIETQPQEWDGVYEGVEYDHRISTDVIRQEAGVGDVLVGDILVYGGTMHYPVVFSGKNWTYLRGVTDVAAAAAAKLPRMTLVGTDKDGARHTWTIYGSEETDVT